VAEGVLLSVVIAAYTTERLKDIRDVLDSIHAQTYKKIEVIFVVDGSAALLEIMQGVDQGPDLRLAFNDGAPGLSRARNLGVKMARGDVIAFLDDDAVALPDWAEQMVKTYEDGSIIGVTGPALPLWEDERMAWFPKDLEWIVGGTGWFSANETCDVRNVWGMNMSFRRAAFDKGVSFSSGFGLRGSQGTVAEETDVSLRVKRATGGRIVYNPRVQVRHKVSKHRLSWRFIGRRSYQIGRSRRMIAEVHAANGDGEDPLTTEHHLARLFPGTLRTCLKDPAVACRRFAVTLVALSSVGLGYLSAILFPFNGGPVGKEIVNGE
jgi:glycosyltransferase involved in cell wall biosynthesis